ncbi:DUF5980 family protein [Streptomyces sp. NPDC057621]|uniref:DUF5980 family protein n=1 Tax=Streptomyces sp. NPDC057621 TaxID=3346186 RepID=UPI0036B55043
MKRNHHGAGLLLGLLSALTLMLVGSSPASASSSAWTLEAEGQRICVSPQYGWPNTYAFAPVTGSWSSVIRLEVRNLPPGSTSTGGAIYPGTNQHLPDGSLVINGFVGLSFAPAPAGEYTAEIRATDGRHTESDPLLLVFRDGC